MTQELWDNTGIVDASYANEKRFDKPDAEQPASLLFHETRLKQAEEREEAKRQARLEQAICRENRARVAAASREWLQENGAAQAERFKNGFPASYTVKDMKAAIFHLRPTMFPQESPFHVVLADGTKADKKPAIKKVL